MEPSQSALEGNAEPTLPPPPAIVKPVNEAQLIVKLPPPTLERLLMMLDRLNAKESESSRGPKATVAPAPIVWEPVELDKVRGAKARIASSAPTELSKNRLVTIVACAVTELAPKLVNEIIVLLEPDKFNATPVNVPRLESNRPTELVWLISVFTSGLSKLKLTVAAFALSAKTVLAKMLAIDFMVSSVGGLVGNARKQAFQA